MTILVIVIVTTLVLSWVFARAFQKNRRPESNRAPGGGGEILKTLAEGSDQEVKEVIANPRIKVSVTQLQHLGLTKEERRRRNRKLVLSLADSQAKSFIVLKKRISKETCMRIIDDYTHRPSCMGNLKAVPSG